jgi:hypothetical protein
MVRRVGQEGKPWPLPAARIEKTASTGSLKEQLPPVPKPPNTAFDNTPSSPVAPERHVALPSLDLGVAGAGIPNNCSWYALGYLKNLSPQAAATLAGEEQGPLAAALLTVPDPIMSALGLKPLSVELASDWEGVFAELERASAGRFLLVIKFPPEAMPPGTPPSHVMVVEKDDSGTRIIDPSRSRRDAEAITFGREQQLLPITDAMLIRVTEIDAEHAGDMP